MPAILTIKHQEAVEACEKMEQSFDNLNTQINTTHIDGAIPLQNRLNSNQPLINYQQNEINDVDNKSNTLKTKMDDMLQQAIDMNDVPSA